jgi:hypothetical protein
MPLWLDRRNLRLSPAMLKRMGKEEEVMDTVNGISRA